MCLGPAGLGQIAQYCSDSFALFQRYMIEFKAQGTGKPSCGVKINSVARPRMVRVAGTTIISFSRSLT